MSIETYVRFRPVAPLDKAPGNPAALARARWRTELERNPGVVRFTFAPGKIGNPRERETGPGDAAAVDLTITWESIEAANATFSNNSLFEFLCGYVEGAPSVVVEGQEQIAEVPA
ncbi:MAG TPA: hypothetical protein VN238_00820 [Solirubrobacteraceae bacterium]|nr:hypothetical protein [Solirubrobacteraceae bacterium]